MDFIQQSAEIVFHIDKYLSHIIQTFGHWSYLLFFIVIFAETGLVITPFLPGDSLLFALGTFAALGSFNVMWLYFILLIAAILGDFVNYTLGKYFGEKILRGKGRHLIRQKHLDQTHKFYEKYGGKTIILARFIPIVRTFAPFVAGIGKMNPYKFAAYNISGGIIWVTLFVLGGYFFGNAPVIKDNFMIVILAIMVISFLPPAIEYFRLRKREIVPQLPFDANIALFKPIPIESDKT